MNWSNYARFVGDVFGAPSRWRACWPSFSNRPSSHLDLWLDKLPKKLHLATIWLVAIGSTMSAFWILVANSFMQQPVGYVLRGTRAEMVDFGALITNLHVWLQFPHVIFSGLTTGSFFLLGVSAYHLRKKSGGEIMRRSFLIGMVCALLASRCPLSQDMPGRSQAASAAHEDGGGRGSVGDGEPRSVLPAQHPRRGRAEGHRRHPPAGHAELALLLQGGSEVPGLRTSRPSMSSSTGPATMFPP